LCPRFVFEGSGEDSPWLEAAWRKAAEDAGHTEPEEIDLSRLYQRELKDGTRRLSQEIAS
jgi:hypothetical protein